ncbi:MAG: gamma-glutamylcyclotransferase [Promethearchaeota archaeon]|nr:MAG: gamma-glutamylcyclotransferase [Candidatus Lokiarchaeota archaeon]
MRQQKYINIKCDRLFVYGTLQHGQSRNYILRGLKYEKATLLNYKKLEPPSLGFPFIIRDNKSSVEGEVYYGVGGSLFNQIDMIEGEGKLYHRIIVKLKLQDGREAEAYTYYPSEILIKNYV